MIEINATSKGFTNIDPNDYFTLENLHLHGEDFSGKKVKSLSIISSQLYNCHFEKMTLDNAGFGGGTTQSVLTDCIFDNSIFKHCVLANVRFVRCSFKNVKIKDFFSFTGEFIDCTFSGKLKKAIFWGRLFKEEDRKNKGRDFNEFHGNDFSEMEFDDVGFRGGIDLDKQKLPVGDNYIYIPQAQKIIDQARKRINIWEDIKLKAKALKLLEFLEFELKYDQKQLFLSRDYFENNEAENKVYILFQELIKNLSFNS